jgi:hypothetical protein
MATAEPQEQGLPRLMLDRPHWYWDLGCFVCRCYPLPGLGTGHQAIKHKTALQTHHPRRLALAHTYPGWRRCRYMMAIYGVDRR